MKKTAKYPTIFLLLNLLLYADDGYRLWLKYDRITDQQVMHNCQQLIQGLKEN